MFVSIVERFYLLVKNASLKKIIVLFVLTLSLATTVFAQVRKVPAEVTEA